MSRKSRCHFCQLCFTLSFTLCCSSKLLGLTQGMCWEEMPGMSNWIFWFTGLALGDCARWENGNEQIPCNSYWELLQSIAAIMFAAATMRHSPTWCAGISQRTDSLIIESDTFGIVLFLKQGLTLAKANLELGVLLPLLPRVLGLETCQNTNLTFVFLVSLVFIISCNKLWDCLHSVDGDTGFTVGRKLAQGHLIWEAEDRHWSSSFLQTVLNTWLCCLWN